MSFNTFGKIFRFTTWGESHGPAIGCVVDGCPPNIPLSEKDIQTDMDRRRPGKSKFTSQRKESDKVEFLSGVFQGKTTGTPISMIIYNKDARSRDYETIKNKFRPGHADYTYLMKYGIRDYRGGGRQSARETASRVAAGAIAKIVGLKSCEYYNRQFKTNYFTLMPCNMYGPNDNFDIRSSHFIPGLIKKFYTANRKNKKNVEVWGSGKAKREIMHVDDLASAIFFILNKVEKKDKKVLAVLKKNSHINVGANKEYTIKQYANMIGKLFKKKINLKFNKSYPDGTPRKLLDSSIIYSMGWKPIISIEKGLRETLEWYKENVK